VDFVFFSPPYEDCRSYGIDFALKGQQWVDWILQVIRELSRVCTGLVACVVEGKTHKYRWSATPALLMTDLHRAGFHLRKPPAYRRVGIPGSGGPDWLRNDYEFIVCVARPGRLPWSDNTACGHPPKYEPGGAMSYRQKDGSRVTKKRRADGSKQTQNYTPPKRANPGNVVTEPLEEAAVAVMLRTLKDWGYSDGIHPANIVSCKVGGGHMGSKLAHDNEAPFPLAVHPDERVVLLVQATTTSRK
jgi:hypothetical protein